MNQTITTIKRALLSVSDKTGIIEFAGGLQASGIEIISTGGTSETLRAAGIVVRDVSEITGFPEVMDGRVKTLHPRIHGGILGLRDEHADTAKLHDIIWIDLVVVNLYPFGDVIKKPDATFDAAIENIDIGGPTMIRSAAKNMGWVGVVVDYQDYPVILEEIRTHKGLTFDMRKQLAVKAFADTAKYDAMIYSYLNAEEYPNRLMLNLKKHAELRYGENPHQTACAYRIPAREGILTAKQYQGKTLSYNNIVDADAAVACVREFENPACVIVKHANPSGAAMAATVEIAFDRAFDADPLAAFGGIIAINRECTAALAEKIAAMFCEVFVAPAYSAEALTILKEKPNLRVLELNLQHLMMQHELTFVEGGVLIQDKDALAVDPSALNTVTKRQPDAKEMEALLFAWRLVKHIKSNAILITKDDVTLGVGAGQVSRIDAVDLAIHKAKVPLQGAVLASDAFFPFRDSIDRIASVGIAAIIQPGGSLRDNEIIAACDEHGIAMVFTGRRSFKH